MNCPNCGLANSDGAKFCANCGTSLGSAPSSGFASQQSQSQYQGSLPDLKDAPMRGVPRVIGRSTFGRNLAIGCLLVVVIVLLMGFSCMRACFRMGRRSYRRR